VAWVAAAVHVSLGASGGFAVVQPRLVMPSSATAATPVAIRP
jgi:hypothetical protein